MQTTVFDHEKPGADREAVRLVVRFSDGVVEAQTQYLGTARENEND